MGADRYLEQKMRFGLEGIEPHRIKAFVSEAEEKAIEHCDLAEHYLWAARRIQELTGVREGVTGEALRAESAAKERAEYERLRRKFGGSE